ncbi:hypothetical protein G6L00_06165 [Agrobacterium rhizogenes]|nr:hypothetical protein [Rhizobium rhizogenes]
MRSISDIGARALKAATVAAYEALGGVSLVSEILTVGISTLSKYASFNHEWRENFIRIDLAVELDRRADHPFILTTMARELGYELVRDVRVEVISADLSPTGVLRLHRILDDVGHETARAIEDGYVDAAERQNIRRKIALAMQELARLDGFMIGGAK